MSVTLSKVKYKASISQKFFLISLLQTSSVTSKESGSILSHFENGYNSAL